MELLSDEDDELLSAGDDELLSPVDDELLGEALSEDETLEEEKLEEETLEEEELEDGLLEEELIEAALLGELELELDDDGFGDGELDGEEVGAADDDGGVVGDDEGGGDGELLEAFALLDELPPELLPAPLKPPSNTTKLALLPLGTVTTQKLAPPAPSVLVPVISFTVCLDGSMAHGRPLQPPPSQTISTPQVGILSRNGVAGSR